MNHVKTLQQAIQYFSDADVCQRAVMEMRWPNGVECPECGHKEHYYLATQRRWKCKDCKRQFSVKIGTIFEDSALGLDKWLCALWMLVNCKNGISSYEVGRALGVTQKSAWFMLHRLRYALQNGSMMKLGESGGVVEADDTYIGGLARNMHASKRNARIHSGKKDDKTIAWGALERGGQVRTAVVRNVRQRTINPLMNRHVSKKATVYTDMGGGYRNLGERFTHDTIDHAVCYVSGKVHTNGIENFWSLLKRGLKGTYVSVEPFHLFRYLDEQAWRFNNRELAHDGARFNEAIKGVCGKRLTYATLTGKQLVSETRAD